MSWLAMHLGGLLYSSAVLKPETPSDIILIAPRARDTTIKH